MSHKTLPGSNQAKYWGNTQCIFIHLLSEAHRIEAVKGGFCSKHKHQNKWNRFFVESGELRVTIYKEHGEEITVVKPGQFTDVPPGVYHRFEALTDVVAYEFYWVDGIQTNDIVRDDVGGRKKTEKEEMEEKFPSEEKGYH